MSKASGNLPPLATWAISAAGGVVLNVVLSVSNHRRAPALLRGRSCWWAARGSRRRRVLSSAGRFQPSGSAGRPPRPSRTPRALTAPAARTPSPQLMACCALLMELTRIALGRPDKGEPKPATATVVAIPGTGAAAPVIVAQIDSDDDAAADIAPPDGGSPVAAPAPRPAAPAAGKPRPAAGAAAPGGKQLPPVVPGVHEVVHIPVDAEKGARARRPGGAGAACAGSVVSRGGPGDMMP